MLNNTQIERYARHILLPNVGGKGQQKLLQARVLYVGAGGLGCPALTYLAAAGVGTLAIVDPDTISLSNLHRQFVYTPPDIGQAKALILAERLQQQNPDVTVHPFVQPFFADLVQDYDIVADGSDNFATRVQVAQAAKHYQKPLISAAVLQWHGEVATFTPYLPRHACYQCVYPQVEQAVDAQNCASAGVMGAVAGVVGAYQAVEIIKCLLNIGASNILHRYQALTGQWQRFKLVHQRDCHD